MFNVRLFKAKKRVFKFNTYQKNKHTYLSQFEVQKDEVRVCSMSNLVNQVKDLLDSVFDIRSLKMMNKVFEFGQ